MIIHLQCTTTRLDKVQRDFFFHCGRKSNLKPRIKYQNHRSEYRVQSLCTVFSDDIMGPWNLVDSRTSGITASEIWHMTEIEHILHIYSNSRNQRSQISSRKEGSKRRKRRKRRKRIKEGREEKKEEEEMIEKKHTKLRKRMEQKRYMIGVMSTLDLRTFGKEIPRQKRPDFMRQHNTLSTRQS